jgi:phage shock protein A
MEGQSLNRSLGVIQRTRRWLEDVVDGAGDPVVISIDGVERALEGLVEAERHLGLLGFREAENQEEARQLERTVKTRDRRIRRLEREGARKDQDLVQALAELASNEAEIRGARSDASTHRAQNTQLRGRLHALQHEVERHKKKVRTTQDDLTAAREQSAKIEGDLRRICDLYATARHAVRRLKALLAGVVALLMFSLGWAIALRLGSHQATDILVIAGAAAAIVAFLTGVLKFLFRLSDP